MTYPNLRQRSGKGRVCSNIKGSSGYSGASVNMLTRIITYLCEIEKEANLTKICINCFNCRSGRHIKSAIQWLISNNIINFYKVPQSYVKLYYINPKFLELRNTK